MTTYKLILAFVLWGRTVLDTARSVIAQLPTHYFDRCTDVQNTIRISVT